MDDVDLPEIAVRVRDPHLVLPSVSADGVLLARDLQPSGGQSIGRGLHVFAISNGKSKMAERTSRPRRIRDQGENERRLRQLELCVIDVLLRGGNAEQEPIEID